MGCQHAYPSYENRMSPATPQVWLSRPEARPTIAKGHNTVTTMATSQPETGIFRKRSPQSKRRSTIMSRLGDQHDRPGTFATHTPQPYTSSRARRSICLLRRLVLSVKSALGHRLPTASTHGAGRAVSSILRREARLTYADNRTPTRSNEEGFDDDKWFHVSSKKLNLVAKHSKRLTALIYLPVV